MLRFIVSLRRRGGECTVRPKAIICITFYIRPVACARLVVFSITLYTKVYGVWKRWEIPQDNYYTIEPLEAFITDPIRQLDPNPIDNSFRVEILYFSSLSSNVFSKTNN